MTVDAEGTTRPPTGRGEVVMKRLQQARRGGAAVFVLISLTVVIGIAALAVDMGVVYVAKGEMQRAADSAALAGYWKLCNSDRLRGGSYETTVFTSARNEANSYAQSNKVLSSTGSLNLNTNNSSGGDIVLGYLSSPEDLSSSLSTTTASQFNSVQVNFHRDSTRNGGIQLFFARLLGHTTAEGYVTATATFRNDIRGYKVTAQSGNADLLPIALHINSWNNLLNGSVTNGDSYTYNSSTGAVSNGADGVKELNIYPGGGSGQLPPGNFGTVDIGNPNNSTADLSRQIRYGVNASDLAWFGGQIDLSSGYVMMNGDTGLSAAIKDDLEAIKGKPRAIPLFDQVTGPGNNSMYRIVGFGGIRIVYVKLTGAMSGKQVIVQPAFVMDDAVLTGYTSNSKYVYYPPTLTR